MSGEHTKSIVCPTYVLLNWFVVAHWNKVYVFCSRQGVFSAFPSLPYASDAPFFFPCYFVLPVVSAPSTLPSISLRVCMSIKRCAPFCCKKKSIVMLLIHIFNCMYVRSVHHWIIWYMVFVSKRRNKTACTQFSLSLYSSCAVIMIFGWMEWFRLHNREEKRMNIRLAYSYYYNRRGISKILVNGKEHRANRWCNVYCSLFMWWKCIRSVGIFASMFVGQTSTCS